MARSRVRQVIAGLDVGTTKICCVIADWSPVGNLDIIGVGMSPSRGLRMGVLVNIESTVESI
jgi:cell division protein FtsA